MNSCQQCQSPFEITTEDKAFYDKVSPVIAGEKYAIPDPKLCPECRQQRRLAWRNERHLYHRACALNGRQIISMYHPDSPYVVYNREDWWKDDWSALDYGRDFDFSRTFFEQFDDLMKSVPKASLVQFEVVNCEYTNYQNGSKNCYLTFGSGFMEDCAYCYWSYYGKDTFDCSYCSKFELDYQNVSCLETYSSAFCQDCKNISYCWHCFDCSKCQDCFACVGLRNMKYHIFNQAYTKEEYQKKFHEINIPANRKLIESEIKRLKLDHPHLYTRITNSENCSGDEIQNSQNCHNSFDIIDSQDCSYCYDVLQMTDAMDCNRTGIDELVYEACSGGYYNNVLFVCVCAELNFSMYCFECMHSNYLFGCVGLNQNKYCILNKQYSEENYNKLLPRIIEHMRETGEWGEYFPVNISPFAYNETIAQDSYSLTKKEVESKHWRWREIDDYIPEVDQIIPANKLPDNIQEIPNDVLNWAIECEVSHRPFKITPQELNFYRQRKLCLPHKHPDLRYQERMAMRPERKLYIRQCDQCQKEVQSVYPETVEWKVYCEQCYLSEVC